MLIGGQDQPRAGEADGIDRVQELLLGGDLVQEEVDIVDCQKLQLSHPPPEPLKRVVADRVDVLVGELFGGEVAGPVALRAAAEFGEPMDCSLQQVCLAHPALTVEKERRADIGGRGGLLSNPAGRGEREAIGVPDHEVSQLPDGDPVAGGARRRLAAAAVAVAAPLVGRLGDRGADLEEVRGDPHIDPCPLTQRFPGDAVEVAKKVTGDPRGDELRVGGDLDAFTLDVQPGGVAEPHVIAAIANALSQAAADPARCRGGSGWAEGHGGKPTIGAGGSQDRSCYATRRGRQECP